MLPTQSPIVDDQSSAIGFASGRRAFSVPAPRRSSGPSGHGDGSQGDSEGVETLFTHSFAKVVAFNLSTTESRPSSSSSSITNPTSKTTSGTVEWTSPTERTIAAGPLRIYRVPGSVAFLNSGPLLHTIFPKSQCWCVNGESKFVLRIRQNSYYRIELPFNTEEDKSKTRELIDVLNRVLQYEKIPCPFTRNFQVDVPQAESQPPPLARRRSLRPPEKARRWILDDNVWGLESESRDRRTSVSSLPPAFEKDEPNEWAMEDDTHGYTVTNLIPEEDSFQSDASPSRSKFASNSRLAMQSSPTPSLSRRLFRKREVSEGALKARLEHKTSSRPPLRPQFTRETNGSMSVDKNSFYTSESTSQERIEMPPSQSASQSELSNRATIGIASDSKTGRGRCHSRQASGNKVAAPVTRQDETRSRSSSAPSTPTLESDVDDKFDRLRSELITPPSTLRLKRLTGASQRRAFSPMPHPINLWSPSIRSHNNRRLTASIVQKTYTMLFGPPSYLVALMLRIASRISNVPFGKFTYNLGPKNEDEDDWDSSDEDEEWSEDDYGVPLGNTKSSTTVRGRKRNPTWELD